MDVGLLAACCVLQAVIIAILSATVPALWWIHLRRGGRDDVLEDKVRELESDVRVLDELVEKLCRAANLERGEEWRK